MKLVVAAVGRLKAGPERTLYDKYCDRVGASGKSAGLGPVNTLEIAESRKRSSAERCAEEAAQLTNKLDDGTFLVVLDEKGTAMSSREFAKFVGRIRDDGRACLTFAIGGADGHGDDLKAQADKTVSLGRMTLAHGLARVVLAEQIYRAVTILTGHPYHRG